MGEGDRVPEERTACAETQQTKERPKHSFNSPYPVPCWKECQQWGGGRDTGEKRALQEQDSGDVKSVLTLQSGVTRNIEKELELFRGPAEGLCLEKFRQVSQRWHGS